MAKQNKPAIRFKGFTDAWEQRKFEEIAVRSSVICSDDTLPRVEYEDIVSGTGRLNKDIYAKQSSKSGIAFHQGDVLYGKLRPYLQNWLLPTFDGLAVGDFWVLQPQNADSSFLYRLIQSRQFDEVANQSTGTKMPRADWKLVSKTVFSIPSNISEQAAIGTYFTALDSLITLHQRECISFAGRADWLILTENKKRTTSSWEQRKLGELGTITTGNTPSTSIPDYYSDDGIVWVTPTDICENITFESARKLSDLGQQVGRVVPKNTILVTCIASIGKNTMLGNTGSFNQQINGLTPNENKYDPYFLLTESALWSAKMKGSAAAGTMQIVNRTEFSELKTWLPSLIEQQAIGAFFKQLDHLITLHQRKCVFLFGFFQAFISMIFTASTFSWEQRKLGDVGETYTGLSGKTKADFGHGQARFVTYMNVFSNPISNPEMTEPIEIDPKQNEVEVGDVFFTTSSETPEEVGMSSILLEKRGKTYLNSFCFGFRPSEKIDSYYLAYMLRSESTRAKIILLAQGISRYNISKNKVMEIAVSLPSLDEQKLIGQYFSQLDNLITLHQRELEKLQNIKKSMLEKMFV